MANIDNDLFFAAVGDVHGDMYTMLGLLTNWESRFRQKLSFVLQVGDFEPIRHEADLATMDAPKKYLKLGDFRDFYSGIVEFPWPVWFIGGNHEPYGFLDQTPCGTTITKNCHYLGRVGSVILAGLKIVGVSGIYKEDLFLHTVRPPVSQIGSRPNKDYISFTQNEITQALDFESVDILMLHEWPKGIIKQNDLATFHPWRKGSDFEQVGNEYAQMLIEYLQPKLVLCGHMHKHYRRQISFSSNTPIAICCLANVPQKQDAIAVFQLTSDGKILEVT
jgi:lariat debranching enzyme